MKEWVEAHEFPNLIRLRQPLADLDGKQVPARSVLYYQCEGVRFGPADELYGLYMDEGGEKYWVRLADADYAALRVYGYTRAQL
jgi:hypothetical protein